MYTNPHLRNSALIHRALCNERRLWIIELLSKRSFTNSELVEELKIKPSAVSRHLQILLRTKLIEGKKVGKEVHFKVSKKVDVSKVINTKQHLTKC